jgi:hypothetical protein
VADSDTKHRNAALCVDSIRLWYLPNSIESWDNRAKKKVGNCRSDGQFSASQ